MNGRTTTHYVVVQPQIVGTVEKWETVYYSDRVQHPTRKAAIRHGFRVHGHDDWLLAIIRTDRVVGTAWMDKDRDAFPREAEAIADALGLGR